MNHCIISLQEYISHSYYIHNETPGGSDKPQAFTNHCHSLIHTQNAANKNRAPDTKLITQNKKLQKFNEQAQLEAKKKELSVLEHQEAATWTPAASTAAGKCVPKYTLTT